MKRLFLILFLTSFCMEAQSARIEGVRVWPAPDHTRLVFDLSESIRYQAFTLDKPNRVVIDVSQSVLAKNWKSVASSGVLKKIRTSPRKNNKLRVVLDLNEFATPKTFLLKPNKQYGHRLVVDLYPPARKKPEPVPKQPDKIIIAIDAGHGGEDPGASGPGKVREKDVVLAIARHLKKLINKHPGMEPVMIRDGDYYLGLRKRVKRAREQKADLLVSIHADAFITPNVKGASVYILSHNGASSEAARWLAKKENSSDLVGGVKLSDKDEELASVLLDLSQDATLESSYQAADKVLRALGQLGKLHRKNVEQAGFVVLKSPDIPSLLIETAFISNPVEARKLSNRKHQAKIAKAIYKGITSHFSYQLAGKRQVEHRISRGDTLSEIAQQYQVSVNSIRRENDLTGNEIFIGQQLTIPLDSI